MAMTNAEIRSFALEQAVKVATAAPIFHGDASTAQIISYTQTQILGIAATFEDYIVRGK